MKPIVRTMSKLDGSAPSGWLALPVLSIDAPELQEESDHLDVRSRVPARA